MAHRRLPRDLDAEDLIRALARLGYVRVRQTGSHARIKTERGGEHCETIPCHSPLKIGTLQSILRSIESHPRMSRDELLELLDI